jgi:hypothetical protein
MMNIMTGVSITLAVLALGAGFRAVRQSRQASDVQIDLGYWHPDLPPTFERAGMVLQRVSESGDLHMQQMNAMCATWDAQAKSARLNQDAARWTWWAVTLGAASAILAGLASLF